MRAVVDTTSFTKDMNNLVAYANGFLEGVQKGKPVLLKQLGIEVKELLEQYIDANARMNPEALHHVYEWYQAGDPSGRLFNIEYIVSVRGISFMSSFTQSRSIKNGSNVPFSNKAIVMEQGNPVTIRPTNSSVLAFEDNGETVFTRKPVTVSNPGGDSRGQFDDTFKEFFLKYLSQSFLDITGLSQHLKTPATFATNLASGVAGGKPVGVRVGYNWITSKESVI